MKINTEAYRPTERTAETNQFIVESGVTMVKLSSELKDMTKIASDAIKENELLKRREAFFEVATEAARMGVIKQSSIVDWVDEHWQGDRPADVWKEIMVGRKNVTAFDTNTKTSSAKQAGQAPHMGHVQVRAKTKAARNAFFST